jgi:hypothetical protein
MKKATGTPVLALSAGMAAKIEAAKQAREFGIELRQGKRASFRNQVGRNGA